MMADRAIGWRMFATDRKTVETVEKMCMIGARTCGTAAKMFATAVRAPGTAKAVREQGPVLTAAYVTTAVGRAVMASDRARSAAVVQGRAAVGPAHAAVEAERRGAAVADLEAAGRHGRALRHARTSGFRRS
jgi:hypothetical protein